MNAATVTPDRAALVDEDLIEVLLEDARQVLSPESVRQLRQQMRRLFGVARIQALTLVQDYIRLACLQSEADRHERECPICADLDLTCYELLSLNSREDALLLRVGGG